MKIQRFKLLFFGSDHFSVTVLKHLHRTKLCPIRVVTGQHSELDRFSRLNSLETVRWPVNIQDITSTSTNIGLVASFGHLINVETINLFKYGLFNIHPSLLPQYRGSTPVQAAIIDGLKETGCTLMKIPPVAKFDIGDIVLQEKISIGERELATELKKRLAIVGAVLAEKLLLDYEQCLMNVRPQNEQIKSYAKKLKPEDGLLRFKSEESNIIDRKIRAYTGTIELYTYCLNGLKIRLDGVISSNDTRHYNLDELSSILLRQKDVIKDCSPNINSGTMFFHKIRHVLCFKCADNKWIGFDYVTPDHKARMPALDFYNGYLSKVGIEQLETDF